MLYETMENYHIKQSKNSFNAFPQGEKKKKIYFHFENKTSKESINQKYCHGKHLNRSETTHISQKTIQNYDYINY